MVPLQSRGQDRLENWRRHFNNVRPHSSLDYQTPAEFAAKLNEAVSKGTALGSRSDLVAIWVEIANRHQLEMQTIPAFLENQLKLLRASTELRLAQQDLADIYGEVLGLPTRAEMDDLTRMVSELRRELRAVRRTPKSEVASSRGSSAKR